MTKDAPWTPYGLEAIRIRHLRRRRLLALLVAAGLAMVWLFMFQETVTTDFEVEVNGKKQNGIQIDVPPEEKKDGPVTVAIDPGRVTRAETGGAQTQPQVQRPDVPTFDRATPYNWGYYILRFGPWLLIAFALSALAKRRGKHDEVNYGVYKGAMPLEMITASAADEVFTTRWAKAGLFKQSAADYVPLEALVQQGRAERVAQEDEEVARA